jgi:hypothetical protein
MSTENRTDVEALTAYLNVLIDTLLPNLTVSTSVRQLKIH